MATHSETSFLRELRRRGVRGVKEVKFRANRSTIWSLTRNGRVLNVHLAYRTASAQLLDAFATVLRARSYRRKEVRAAARAIREWPDLEPVLKAVRAAHAQRSRSGRARTSPGRCAGTPEQQAYLRRVFRYLNRTRFAGLLPDDLPIRLSRRMTSSLGHMVPGLSRARGRYVVEIALNIDLLLPGNGAERMDTLIHEMAHAAAYLFEGHAGHGPPWKAWARRAGCRVETRYDRSIAQRAGARAAVRRVPPLPAALRRDVA